MICAITPNASVRNKLLSVQTNFNWKVLVVKKTMKKIFKGSQTAWNNFLKPALKIATPIISASVAMKTKNPQSAQVTSSILKPLTGGKILSLTDMHGPGLRRKVW